MANVLSNNPFFSGKSKKAYFELDNLKDYDSSRYVEFKFNDYEFELGDSRANIKIAELDHDVNEALMAIYSGSISSVSFSCDTIARGSIWNKYSGSKSIGNGYPLFDLWINGERISKGDTGYLTTDGKNIYLNVYTPSSYTAQDLISGNAKIKSKSVLFYIFAA